MEKRKLFTKENSNRNKFGIYFSIMLISLFTLSGSTILYGQNSKKTKQNKVSTSKKIEVKKAKQVTIDGEVYEEVGFDKPVNKEQKAILDWVSTKINKAELVDKSIIFSCDKSTIQYMEVDEANSSGDDIHVTGNKFDIKMNCYIQFKNLTSFTLEESENESIIMLYSNSGDIVKVNSTSNFFKDNYNWNSNCLTLRFKTKGLNKRIGKALTDLCKYVKCDLKTEKY